MTALRVVARLVAVAVVLTIFAVVLHWVWSL